MADVISWRKKNLFYCLDSELNHEDVIAKLADVDKESVIPKYRRYFSKEDEIFHVDGKTYLLSNQWGLKP